jgi:hypothetical protein
MFGYVQTRKAELKIKDYELYRSFYCGLCRAIKERGGNVKRLSLSYDCTFLALLLSSLYDAEVSETRCRCLLHPGKNHTERRTVYTDYAADINLLLSYAHFLDDRADDNSLKALAGIRLFREDYLKLKDLHKDQVSCIGKNLSELKKLEALPLTEDSAMTNAACFGKLLAGIFRIRDDAYSRDLSGLGLHLGSFIYLMDAYDDLEEDIKKERYNPFKTLYNRKDFEEKAYDLLYDEAAKAAWYFEKLPCVRYGDILRNILYAGIWNAYDKKNHKETEK